MRCRRFRTLCKRVGIGLVLIAGALVLVYGLAHTRWGRTHLAGWISRAISERMQGEVEIRDLTGTLPFWVGAGRIAVSGSGGDPWLIIEDAHCVVDLRSMWERRPRLASVTARRVTVDRPPASEPGEPAEGSIWERLPALRVGMLHVGALEIGGWIPDGVAEVYAEFTHRDPSGNSRVRLRVRGLGLRAAFDAEGPSGGGDWECRLGLDVEAGSEWHPGKGDLGERAWRFHVTSRGNVSEAAGRVDGGIEGLGSLDGEYGWTFDASPGAKIWSLTFDGESEDLRRMVGGREVQIGRLSGRVRVGGGTDRPLRLEADVNASAIVGVPPVLAAALGPEPQVVAALSIGGGSVTLESVEVMGTGGRLAVEGMVRTRERQAELRFRANLSPGDGWPILAEAEWAAPVHPVAGDGDVSIAWGERPRVEGAVRLGHVEFAAGSVAGTEASAVYDAGAGLMPLSITGRVEGVEVGGLVVRRAWGWGRVGADAQDAGIEAEGAWGTNLTAVVQGDLQRRGQALQVQLNQFDVSHPVLPVRLLEPARISYDSGTSQVERVVVQAGPGRLTANAMTDGDRIHGRVRLEPMALASIPGAESVQGEIRADLELDGSLSQPRIHANLEATDLRPKQDRNGAFDALGALQADATMEWAEGLLRAEARIESPQGGRLDVHSEIPTSLSLVPWNLDRPALDQTFATARGKINLDALQSLPMMAKHHLSGVLELDIDAAGDPLRPQFSGTGRIRGGRYEHVAAGVLLRNLELDLEAKDRVLTLSSLRAQDEGEGTVEGRGTIELHPKEQFPFEFSCDLREVQLIANEVLTASADGSLQVTGAVSGMTVEGMLTLAPVHVDIPRHRSLPPAQYTIVDPMRPAPPPATDPPPASSGYPINLNVRIDIPSRMFVSGRGLDSEWSGQFQIAGTAKEPRISGLLQPRRGLFDFFGQPFHFVDSSIRFTGQSPPRPTLNLTLERVRSSLVVQLKVQGTSADPEFSIHSDPPLPPDEVLPRLLFGRGGGEISALQAVRIAQAARALQGRESAFDFMGSAQRILTVDQLDVRQAESPDASARVTAGKHLSDRVYLSGYNELGAQSSRISLEVELTPRISLTTDVREEMKQGIGIKFKRNF